MRCIFKRNVTATAAAAAARSGQRAAWPTAACLPDIYSGGGSSSSNNSSRSSAPGNNPPPPPPLTHTHNSGPLTWPRSWAAKLRNPRIGDGRADVAWRERASNVRAPARAPGSGAELRGETCSLTRVCPAALAQPGTARHGTARHGSARHGPARYSLPGSAAALSPAERLLPPGPGSG